MDLNTVVLTDEEIMLLDIALQGFINELQSGVIVTFAGKPLTASKFIRLHEKITNKKPEVDLCD